MTLKCLCSTTNLYRGLQQKITLQVQKLNLSAVCCSVSHRSIEEIILHALQVSRPPAWDDVPEEFQGEIAALR